MKKRLFASVLLSVLAASALAQPAAGPSHAASAAEWRKEHPRRTEVNARLAKQDKRIETEVREGEMSRAKAAKLHKQDRQIRQEERDMAAQNGGHITKQQQKTLNQQENAVSKQIGK